MEKKFSKQTVLELGDMVRRLVEGCRTAAYDQTVLYTPDGVASYDALWLRDFSYMVEYAPETIPDSDLEACIRYAKKHCREDGWMPDRTYADGVTCYAAGTLAAPVGKANLDNTPFWTFLIHALFSRLPIEQFAAKFAEWEPDIYRGLSILPRAASGLVYNDPIAPHSPYGFTDTIAKTGLLFYESLLLWRACRMAEEMCMVCQTGHTDWYRQQAERIEAAMMALYDPETKTFFAADADCRQLDVWGNAYLLYIGFPVSDAVREGILDWLCAHYDDYCYMGQIRHLPKGQYWERTLIEVAHEEYQNGAYWATATGWVMWCLYQRSPVLAKKMLAEVLSCFETEGSFECVNEGYRKLNSFVVSATNVYGGLNRIVKENP